MCWRSDFVVVVVVVVVAAAVVVVVAALFALHDWQRWKRALLLSLRLRLLL